jgi:hypothetical protein
MWIFKVAVSEQTMAGLLNCLRALFFSARPCRRRAAQDSHGRQMQKSGHDFELAADFLFAPHEGFKMCG